VHVCNCRVDQFEYTPECTVFDLLNIRLYHGWLADPENLQEVSAVSNCTYNQLVERIITRKSASDEASVIEGELFTTCVVCDQIQYCYK
jgi:hypothetical protein